VFKVGDFVKPEVAATIYEVTRVSTLVTITDYGTTKEEQIIQVSHNESFWCIASQFVLYEKAPKKIQNILKIVKEFQHELNHSM
jgi:hypothetical protein